MAKKESEALVTTTVTTTAMEIAPPREMPPEMSGEIMGNDLVIPRYRIAQPQSPDVIEGMIEKGTWASNLGGCKAAIRAVVLVKAQGQVRWDVPGGEEKPICRSDDALTPDARIAQPYCDVCNKNVKGRLIPVCPEAMWGDEPPRCALAMNFVMVDLDDGTPFMIRFSRTAMQPARILISQYWLKRLAWWEMVFKMALALQKNAKGTYYVPVFSDFTPLSPENATRFREMREQFMAVDLSVLDEAPMEDAGPPLEEAPF